MKGLRSILVAAVAAVAGMVGSANAGTVVLGTSGWAASYDQGIGLTFLGRTNDFTSVSVEKFANFTEGQNQDGFIPPLKITFFQVSNTASSFIKIFDETVINNTGLDWNGFTMVVESDHMGPGGGPKFDPAKSTGWDVTPFTSTVYSEDDTRVTMSGAIIPADSGSGLDNLWTPGGNGPSLTIHAAPFSSGGIRQMFVFKEQPLASAIPLPAAAWSSLTCLGAIVLPGAMKKARRILA